MHIEDIEVSQTSNKERTQKRIYGFRAVSNHMALHYITIRYIIHTWIAYGSGCPTLFDSWKVHESAMLRPFCSMASGYGSKFPSRQLVRMNCYSLSRRSQARQLKMIMAVDPSSDVSIFLTLEVPTRLVGMPTLSRNISAGESIWIFSSLVVSSPAAGLRQCFQACVTCNDYARFVQNRAVNPKLCLFHRGR